MYGLAEILMFPDSDTPHLEKIEVHDSFDKAKIRSDELMKVFFDEYGEDYGREATPKRPIAEAYNGEVVWFAYISEIKEK